MTTKTTKKKNSKQISTKKKSISKGKVIKPKKANSSKVTLKPKTTPKNGSFLKKKTLSNSTKKSTQKISKKSPVSVTTYPKEQDIVMLSDLGHNSNLDMMVFQHITLGNTVSDIIYSSNDTAIICKVLSDKHTWIVDTTHSIENCTWTDETGATLKPCAELLAQVKKLQQIEPNAKIIPSIILMRGSIKNEAVAQAYFQKNHIQLIKYNEGKQQSNNELKHLLNRQFPSLLEKSRKIAQSHRTVSALKIGLPNPTQKSHLTKSLAALSTLGQIGYFPKGSGTLGALVALPIAYLLSRTCPTLLWIVTTILFVLGFFAVQQFTADKKEKDPGCVIIDEVVGQLMAFWLIIPDLMHWPMLLLGFLLFRVFDIFKFGPVAFWDRRKNPMGVMMDDVCAGILAAFVLAMLQVIIVEVLGF